MKEETNHSTSSSQRKFRISQAILDRLNNEELVTFVAKLGIKVTKKGRTFKGLSPFTNEKTPSFYVHPEKNIFKDFSSGLGGNRWTLAKEYLKLDWRESVIHMAKEFGFSNDEIFESSSPTPQSLIEATNEAFLANARANMKKGNPAYDYLTGRGFSHETISEFEIGYCDQYCYNGLDPKRLVEAGIIKNSDRSGGVYRPFDGRLLIPLRDEYGHLVAFAGRTLKNEKVKYINSPNNIRYNKSTYVYGLFQNKKGIRGSGRFVATEGYFDVMMARQVGIVNAGAVCGTGMTGQHIATISKYASKIYLCPDGDSAGKKALYKWAMTCLAGGKLPLVMALDHKQDLMDVCMTDNPKEALRKSCKKLVDYLSPLILEWARDEKLYLEASNKIREIREAVEKSKDPFFATMINNQFKERLKDLYSPVRVGERAKADMVQPRRRTNNLEEELLIILIHDVANKDRILDDLNDRHGIVLQDYDELYNMIVEGRDPSQSEEWADYYARLVFIEPPYEIDDRHIESVMVAIKFNHYTRLLKKNQKALFQATSLDQEKEIRSEIKTITEIRNHYGKYQSEFVGKRTS